MDDFYSYIGNAMRIPQAARSTVKGKIYLTFVVETNGRIVETKIIRELGYGLDEEAIRVSKVMENGFPERKEAFLLEYCIPYLLLYNQDIKIIYNS